MERIKDDFLDMLEAVVPLAGKQVLEVGCGNGIRSAQVAKRCEGLFGVDTNQSAINAAIALEIPNASFAVQPASKLHLPSLTYDVVIFPLSLHEMPLRLMSKAIDEAVRVAKKDGYIVFLEPGFDGPFFEAEIKFNAGDGDERKAKAAAQSVIENHPKLDRSEGVMFYDETGFRYSSTQDFIAEMHPQKNLHDLEAFLRRYDFCLKAVRHTQIFKPRA